MEATQVDLKVPLRAEAGRSRAEALAEAGTVGRKRLRKLSPEHRRAEVRGSTAEGSPEASARLYRQHALGERPVMGTILCV